MLSISWILVVFLAAASVEAISQISIKGSKFFNAEGQQVFFKGIIRLSSILMLQVWPTSVVLMTHFLMKLNVNSMLHS
jgi:hypothetical protein